MIYIYKLIKIEDENIEYEIEWKMKLNTKMENEIEWKTKLNMKIENENN